MPIFFKNHYYALMVLSKSPTLLIFVTLLVCAQSTAQLTRSSLKQSLPLFEFGVGLFSIDYPDYPGSNHNRSLTLPFPAGIYRGQYFRSDEEGGIRSPIFDQENYELNFSFGGALPANSKDNVTRAGMPNLRTVIEMGPSLVLKLKKATIESPTKIYLTLPIRAALSIDFPGLTEEGLTFNPLIYYLHEGLIDGRVILFASLDLRFSTRKYWDFFYTVDSEFSTPQRPEFRAKAGYGGVSVFAGLSYLFPSNISLFGGVLQSNYDAASNTSSPLLVKRTTTTVLAGLIWWFYQSEAQEKKSQPRAQTVNGPTLFGLPVLNAI